MQVHEIHNETLCSVTSYLDGSPVEQGAGGNEGQHPYDTSPHAQEHQNEARSSVIGGTIVSLSLKLLTDVLAMADPCCCLQR